MSALPKENLSFNWGNLWADLLKGAGRGLLEYDGSRAAQAALAGIEVFDAAQEQRRQQGEQEPGKGTDQYTLQNLWSGMSPAEWAAFLRQPLEKRNAWAEEWAQVPSDGISRAGQGAPAPTTPPPYAGRPISINPFDRWHLQSVLPFSPDGRLNRPTYRR